MERKVTTDYDDETWEDEFRWEDEFWKQLRPSYEEQCSVEGHRYYGNDLDCEDGRKHRRAESCTCGTCYCGYRRFDRFGNPISR